MTLGFSSREREGRQRKLRKGGGGVGVETRCSGVVGEGEGEGLESDGFAREGCARPAMFTHESYAHPTVSQESYVQQHSGYFGSPPSFAYAVSPPTSTGHVSPPQQHHPVYGAAPQMPQQPHQPYPVSPPYQQSQPYYGDSTASFATQPPLQPDGTLKTRWNRAGRLASKSYQDLTAQVSSGAQKSVEFANKSVAVTMTTFVERPTTLVTQKSVQMINQSAALCDRLNTKLDAVITSIDAGVFSGKEHDLLVEHDDAPHASTSTSTTTLDRSTTAPQHQHPSPKPAKSSNMFSKVWLYSNSRLPPHLPPFKVYIPTYPLLCLAASYSERVYAPATAASSETHVPADWRSGTKAMILTSLPRDDMNTIVFAIRGSQTFMDWAVNYQSAPTSPQGFLPDAGNLCHAGFLHVARKMVSPVAARLRVLLSENPSRASASLLITGHSAGGAVAALLYAHMMGLGGLGDGLGGADADAAVHSELSYLTGFFKRVHCVTFGAPPVALLPLVSVKGDTRARKSLFYAFVNEGDPVPRADKAVVRSLVKLWSSPSPSPSSSSLSAGMSCASVSKLSLGTGIGMGRGKGAAAAKTKSKTKTGRQAKTAVVSTRTTTNETSASATTLAPAPAWPVVPCTLSNAGRLIVLREVDVDGTRIEAVTVDDEMLRTVVYGDPVKHQMSMYRARVEMIATRAVTGGG